MLLHAYSALSIIVNGEVAGLELQTHFIRNFGIFDVYTAGLVQQWTSLALRSINTAFTTIICHAMESRCNEDIWSQRGYFSKMSGYVTRGAWQGIILVGLTNVRQIHVSCVEI